MFQIVFEDKPDDFSFLLIDDQFLSGRVTVIAENRESAAVFSALFCRRNFIADTLGDNLPFILGKSHQNIEHHPPCRGGSIDFLSHADKRYIVFIEKLLQLAEITQGSGQPVDFVNHDYIDQPRLDIFLEFLQSGAVHITAGKTAVIVVFRQAEPAVAFLTGNVIFAGFPLGIQTVELLFKPLFVAFAGVDRTPELSFNFFCHITLLRKNAFRSSDRR